MNFIVIEDRSINLDHISGTHYSPTTPYGQSMLTVRFVGDHRIGGGTVEYYGPNADAIWETIKLVALGYRYMEMESAVRGAL